MTAGDPIPPARPQAGRPGLSDGGLDADTLRLWQLQRLRAAVAYVRERSVFYGDRLAGVEPGQLQGFTDLEALPFTWPADVVRNPLAFLCVPLGVVSRVTTLRTSGTSGPSKRLFFTKADLLRTVDFFEQGMRQVVTTGQRVLNLLPGGTADGVGSLLRASLARLGVEVQVRDGGWTVSAALGAATGAHCVLGMPTDVLYLCRTAPQFRPDSVLLSADYVPRAVVRAIEETWRCHVFTHYGMTETGFGCAVQCRWRESHHLRHADMLVEIVDPESGRCCEAGRTGEIVVTTFSAEAMPLIRYRTGDSGCLVDGRCACGSVLPRLGRVGGRRENDLPLAGGGTISIHRLDEAVFGLAAVRGFRTTLRRERGRDVLSLTIDAVGRLDEQALADSMPAGVGVEVQYGEVPPFAGNRKRRIGSPVP